MDIFLMTLLSSLLAEMGDRPQILVAALAMRYANNRAVLAGLVFATLLNCVISAFAGAMVHDYISDDPLILFTAIAYIFAAISMLGWRHRVNILSGWKLNAALTTFLGVFILQFGDKSQFIIAAHAARSDQAIWAALGGTIGILAATIPAIYLGAKMGHILPLKALRITGGAIFLLIGIYLALTALRLIGN
ncbi:hypothetical protein LPB140_02615 [Sphingorhabdus lutea]|uniref:GDT1 family protein n=1 Tax=Sphingorhabdus lutea TaxID=1913578 RepID=A0A1L3J9V2_9SPHN|nr:TMEM165/GDT1 family protein [Sphingorhabdus lutea]APG61899.1 hypothetical protein LPB140_02615 [Sphingorhabdus lutea]